MGLRRGRQAVAGEVPWWLWGVAALLVVCVAAGVLVFVQRSSLVELGDVSPVQDALLDDHSVDVSFSLPGYLPGRGTPVLMVDGETLEAGEIGLAPGVVVATLSLGDGRHEVALDYTSANLFCRHLRKAVSFVVDTSPPVVAVVSPSSAEVSALAGVRFEAVLAEPAAVRVTLDGVPVTVKTGGSEAGGGAAAGDAGGAAHTPAGDIVVSADLRLSDGEHDLVVVATDAAGNASTTEVTVRADLKAPGVRAEGWPEGVWRETAAAPAFVVTDNFAAVPEVRAELDGEPVPVEPGAAASAMPETRVPVPGEVPAGRSASSLVCHVQTGELAEGLHDLTFIAVDGVGHETTWTRSFLVDTTETFGSRPMGPGSEGADVSALQAMLAGRGFYEASATGVYDDVTTAAVADYQRACAGADSSDGPPPAGVVDLQTAGMLLGSVRIDLSERRLYLHRDGGLTATYSVAVGMAAYPTPLGSFHIISKVVDPTWTPPHSAWAAGLSPVPPGLGNPLGTRWMGLDAPSVGIHGTYASGSIGSAASHGCIRMLLRQAEELFALVYVGTPVDIVP